MFRRDPTFLIALCVALAAHWVLLRAADHQMRHDLGWWLAGSTAQAQAATQLAIIPPPPPPDLQIGDTLGRGKSINTIHGDNPMESAISDPIQEQALASREPPGFGKTQQGQPLDQVLKGDDSANPAPQKSALSNAQKEIASAPAPRSAAKPPIPQPKQNTSPTPPAPALNLIDVKAPDAPPADNPLAAGPLAAKPKPKSPDQQQPSPQKPQDQQKDKSDSQSSDAHTPKTGSSDSSAGKPIPPANFESVPVTIIQSRFIPGELLARTGRKMRTREIPDLTLAGWLAVDQLDQPIVVLRLKIDETGNVVGVQTVHSGGSSLIDLPCERAAETWWFEPRKDPDTGKPTIDVVDFVITFK